MFGDFRFIEVLGLIRATSPACPPGANSHLLVGSLSVSGGLNCCWLPYRFKFRLRVVFQSQSIQMANNYLREIGSQTRVPMQTAWRYHTEGGAQVHGIASDHVFLWSHVSRHTCPSLSLIVLWVGNGGRAESVVFWKGR